MSKKSFLFRYEEGSDIDKWLEKQERKSVSIEQAIRIVIANLGDQDIMQALAQMVNISHQQQPTLESNTPVKARKEESKAKSEVQSEAPEKAEMGDKEQPESEDSGHNGGSGDIDMGMFSSL